jgi:hypothetical protein
LVFLVVSFLLASPPISYMHFSFLPWKIKQGSDGSRYAACMGYTILAQNNLNIKTDGVRKLERSGSR